MGNENILDTIQVSIGDNTVATLDTVSTLANLSATMYDTVCCSSPVIKIDKGWLKNQARIFLDKRDTSKNVSSIEQLFEEFINFLEL